PIALVGLLHREDCLATTPGLPHRLVEQVSNYLVAVRCYANPLAVLDQVEDQLSADRCLSRTRRPLNRQVSFVQVGCQQLRYVLGSLARLYQWGSFDDTVDPGR